MTSTQTIVAFVIVAAICVAMIVEAQLAGRRERLRAVDRLQPQYRGQQRRNRRRQATND